jgi:hypothetical protein
VKLPAQAEWPGFLAALDERGYAVLPGLLDPGACGELAVLYDHEEAFRSRVVMAHHNFGRGEYQYLRYPLPPVVAALREALYPALVPLANQWHERLRLEPRFPATLAAYLARCHAAGQQRPTPLILKYEAGDYNCLHQDLYGDFVFPVQATVLLSAPERDFAGGEFMLVEQRPRMQSKGEVVPLGHGDAVIFAVNHRPVAGARGVYRARMRHGVSRLRRGRRFTLGIIFHDAA